MTTSNFYRQNYSSTADLDAWIRENRLPEHAVDLAMKVKLGNFVLAARYNFAKQLGEVRAVGRVTRIGQSVQLDWRAAHFNLIPAKQGRQFWSQDHFNFDALVAKRYELDSRCTELFPEALNMGRASISQITHANAASTGTPLQSGSGHVYVIKSAYGYKIGKSKNLRDRTRLFGVKLPFPIEVLMTGWFEDYSEAEIRFHRQFAHKRLEGEWFDLNQVDLQALKLQLGHVQIQPS